MHSTQWERTDLKTRANYLTLDCADRQFMRIVQNSKMENIVSIRFLFLRESEENTSIQSTSFIQHTVWLSVTLLPGISVPEKKLELNIYFSTGVCK